MKPKAKKRGRPLGWSPKAKKFYIVGTSSIGLTKLEDLHHDFDNVDFHSTREYALADLENEGKEYIIEVTINKIESTCQEPTLHEIKLK